MRTRIKICCLKSYEDARTAIQYGADAVGFIGLVPPPLRTLPDTDIANIVAQIPPPVATCIISSHTNAAQIIAQVHTTGVSTVQLSAPDIEVSELKQLRRDLKGVRLVKVIHVTNGSVLTSIEKYSPFIHAFLLDSGNPNLSTPEYGGTGLVHDWNISAEFVRQSPLPTFLAGGLKPENVADAIATVQPFGVDLCNGVRTNGDLDMDKLGRFFTAVNQADARLKAGVPGL